MTPSTCNATVADFMSCINAQTAIIQQLLDCAGLTVETLAAAFPDGGPSSQPPLCVLFLPGGSCYPSISVNGVL